MITYSVSRTEGTSLKSFKHEKERKARDLKMLLNLPALLLSTRQKRVKTGTTVTKKKKGKEKSINCQTKIKEQAKVKGEIAEGR